MFVTPLPGEHIYSYLYRAYKLHDVNALHTIINSDGLFKRRLALIKYEYIKDFVPVVRDEESLWWTRMILPVLARSNFMLHDLNMPADNRVTRGQVMQFGLRLKPRYRVNPVMIKFCPHCIEESIREFGAAYLKSDWLGDAVMCQEHNRELVSANCRCRKEARDALSEVYQAKGNGFDEVSTFAVA